MQRLAATAWSLLLGLTLSASLASAQPVPAQPAPPELVFTQAEAAAGAPAADVAAPVAQAPQAPAPRLVLPVVVIALPQPAVTPAVLAAIRDALVAGLTPAAGGRPVVALQDEARLAALATCHDPICFGARLNELQAMTGVVVTATRRNRFSPIDVRVDMLDPVSGASRLAAPAAVALPAAAEASPSSALAPVLAQLATAMPSPPPPSPTLLVVTNVDEATVTLDGRVLGTSPIAPVELPPGRYNVVVSARGWASGNRMVQLGDTGPTRVDFDLEPAPETLAALESQRGWSASEGNAAPGSDVGGDETPFYLRWYTIAGAAAVVATIVIVGVAASSGGTEPGPPAGIPIPPIVAP
jgi:hypothetical protein